jgi:hypothetical protein
MKFSKLFSVLFVFACLTFIVMAQAECPIEDTDGDFVPDSKDNCLSTPNRDQKNSDADTLGDLCDNCPSADNQDQADLDGDKIGDACDTDKDGDTINNDVDNCPDIANTDQANLDKDPKGDLCDDDIDGDGLLNENDPCPYAPANDPDKDGICDNEDACLNDINNRCAQLAITEVMPDPAGVADTKGEFIEIYNRSTATVTLDGWTIEDATHKPLALTGTLAAGKLIVLVRDIDPTLNCSIQNGIKTSISLQNSDYESLILKNPAGKVARLVEYLNMDWPICEDADGNGYSLELINADNNGDDPLNWRCSTKLYCTYTDGKKNYGTPGSRF